MVYSICARYLAYVKVCVCNFPGIELFSENSFAITDKVDVQYISLSPNSYETKGNPWQIGVTQV